MNTDMRLGAGIGHQSQKRPGNYTRAVSWQWNRAPGLALCGRRMHAWLIPRATTWHLVNSLKAQLFHWK